MPVYGVECRVPAVRGVWRVWARDSTKKTYGLYFIPELCFLHSGVVPAETPDEWGWHGVGMGLAWG
jgi:hypothetical protein